MPLEGNSDIVWEGPDKGLTIRNGQICTYDMFVFQGDDPLLQALEGTWSNIFNEIYECPLGLKLGSPDFTTCHLGDFLAFCLSYGASPRTGTNRLFCLVLKIMAQIGEFLSDPIKQMSCLVSCDKRKLPIVKPYQRKQRLLETDLGVSDETEGSDVRLDCLALIKDSCMAISMIKSKSLTIITDAADVAGTSVSLLYKRQPFLLLESNIVHRNASSPPGAPTLCPKLLIGRELHPLKFRSSCFNLNCLSHVRDLVVIIIIIASEAQHLSSSGPVARLRLSFQLL